jgi:hypothetical protein
MAESMGNAGAPSGSAYRGDVACDVAARKGQLTPGFDGGIPAIGGYPMPTSTPFTTASPCFTGDAHATTSRQTPLNRRHPSDSSSKVI